jgi:hypothetical protein
MTSCPAYAVPKVGIDELESIAPLSCADRAFWQGIREALLLEVDVIERYVGISPRTAELRRLTKLV